MENATPDQHASLIAAHHARLKAVKDGDLDELAKVVGEDMIFVSATGTTLTRADVFAAFQAGAMKVARMDSFDISTRLYDDIGILMYSADAKTTNGDEVVEGITKSTTVYQLRDGQWMMISQHQSAVAAE